MTTTSTPYAVGAAIRAEMGRQRLTMVELARRTDVPRSTLAYQIHNSALTVANLLLIAGALKVPVADLVGEVAA